jgi:hypothetical protein
MTEGRHYWEVEVTNCTCICDIMFGAVRPGLDHDMNHYDSDDAYYISGGGGLWGNGKEGDGEQGEFREGDRVGCLLDLDAGWLRFYHHGERCGPGFTEGVTGPLVRAVELARKRDAVTAVPEAQAPEGAGDVGESWEELGSVPCF